MFKKPWAWVKVCISVYMEKLGQIIVVPEVYIGNLLMLHEHVSNLGDVYHDAYF